MATYGMMGQVYWNLIQKSIEHAEVATMTFTKGRTINYRKEGGQYGTYLLADTNPPGKIIGHSIKYTKQRLLRVASHIINSRTLADPNNNVNKFSAYHQSLVGALLRSGR